MFSVSRHRENCEMPCLPCASVLGLSRLQQIYIKVKNKTTDTGRKTTCESVRKKEKRWCRENSMSEAEMYFVYTQFPNLNQHCFAMLNNFSLFHVVCFAQLQP